MRYKKRTVLVGTVVLLAGCLVDTSSGDAPADGSSGADTENQTNETESATDDSDGTGPYADIGATFSLSGMFVDETDVENGFGVVPSDADRFHGVDAYDALFEQIESVPESDREPGLLIGTPTVRRDSDSGIAVRETVHELQTDDEVQTGHHPRNRKSNVWGAHYVEHDGAIVLAFLRTAGAGEAE